MYRWSLATDILSADPPSFTKSHLQNERSKAGLETVQVYASCQVSQWPGCHVDLQELAGNAGFHVVD